MRGGDSDSNCAVLGAMYGAKYGIEAFDDFGFVCTNINELVKMVG